MRLPIEGKEGWFKNVDTGSVDCSNKRGYEAYMSCLLYTSDAADE